MSFRSIVRDVRDSFGNISRRGYEVFLSGHCRGKTSGSTRDMYDKSSLVLYSCWANLPQELLIDIIKRMEESESTWPSRKHVLACAAVCRTWREMCKEIIKCPELSGKITFLASLKQPGARNGNIQCFIRRDEANSTYRLYLCLSNEAGKFLLSSKRIRRTTCTEYIISTDANNISRSSKSYAGRLKSNFLGTKFLIYDTQPLLYNETGISGSCQRRHRFYSRKVSPRILSGSYNTAQITYELNVLGTRCPRRMNCMMYSIPASSLAPGGSVACRRHPEDLFSHSTMEDSFHRSMSFSKSSIMDHSIDFSSCRFSDTRRVTTEEDDKDDELKMKNNDRPLVLQNKSPRWHEQLECWCLNFCGRVTVASVKNFQLVASTQSPAGLPTPEAQPAPPDHDKIILQFGKIGRDRFTMDYRYPLSAFQAFAICLSSFDTKIACE